MHEPVNSGKHWAALGLPTYLGQPGVAEGDVIHLQLQGDLSSLSDAGEFVQGIW